jgi:hypothetical protein
MKFLPLVLLFLFLFSVVASSWDCNFDFGDDEKEKEKENGDLGAIHIRDERDEVIVRQKIYEVFVAVKPKYYYGSYQLFSKALDFRHFVTEELAYKDTFDTKQPQDTIWTKFFGWNNNTIAVMLTDGGSFSYIPEPWPQNIFGFQFGVRLFSLETGEEEKAFTIVYIVNDFPEIKNKY